MSDLGVIVTGVAVGSASGILGAICGAWLTARSQMAGLKLGISAENERARIAEKRRIYARCLATFNEAWLSPFKLKGLVEARAKMLGDPSAILALFDQDKQLMTECMNCMFEVALMAPEVVVNLAGTATRRIIHNPEQFSKAIENLAFAMRADLGEPPLAEGIKPLAPEPADQAADGPQPAEGSPNPAT